MADTGVVIVGTGASDASFGDVAWSNPTRVNADDNSDASCALGFTAENTRYLKGTNLGLSVPSGATIDGVEVQFEWRSSTGGENCTLTRCRIVKADASIGTTERSDGAAVPAARTVKTLGGASDLWGESWADTDVNDVDFGFVLAIAKATSGAGETVQVDAMWIKVYYTEGGGGAVVKGLMLLGVGL